MDKIYATEAAQKITRTGMEIMGLYSQLKQDSKHAKMRGEMEKYFRCSVVETIYGGTSEIQRNIIATRGLGLPR